MLKYVNASFAEINMILLIITKTQLRWFDG